MTMPVRALIALVGLALSAAVHAETGEGAMAPHPVVRAPAGSVRGVLEDGARKFRAIPYAKPPLAARRWRAPEP